MFKYMVFFIRKIRRSFGKSGQSQFDPKVKIQSENETFKLNPTRNENN